LFDYDAGAPLAIREVGVRNRGGVRVRDITYAAPGRRVRAYLVEPPGKGPFAGAVFLHWYAPAQPNGNRTEFLDEAAALARRGVVSVLPEGLFPWVESPKGDERDRELIARQVVELRRALDLLASREDVDPKRIGYVGHDYGAMYGALLASVDKRPRAYALMAPDATFGNWFLAFFVPPGDDAQRARYLEALAPLDPIYHVRRAAPGALLFQFGRYDQFIPEDTARQLSGAGSQPKRVEFYDAGHDLRDLEGKPTAAGGDRARWLGERLGLGGAQ
jgi:dienelactone hydrolase